MMNLHTLILFLLLSSCPAVFFTTALPSHARAVCDPGLPSPSAPSPHAAQEADTLPGEGQVPPAGGDEGILPRLLPGREAEVSRFG